MPIASARPRGSSHRARRQTRTVQLQRRLVKRRNGWLPATYSLDSLGGQMPPACSRERLVPNGQWNRSTRRALTVLSSAVLALAVAALPAPVIAPAAADTAPPTAVPPTVAADALPTVQINGVVWDQLVVGNRVYVTGQFTRPARPAPPAGHRRDAARQHPRLRHHHRQAGHQLRAAAERAGLHARAPPDGTTLFVGGDFTSDQRHATGYRIAALDPNTGAVLPTFTSHRERPGAGASDQRRHALRRWGFTAPAVSPARAGSFRPSTARCCPGRRSRATTSPG